MRELELKYGCNPNQKPARIFMSVHREVKDLPLEVLNGRPGYINFLDALNSWQLVRELKSTLNICAAASFKHVSPAGAALGLALNDDEKKLFFVENKTAGAALSTLNYAAGAALNTLNYDVNDSPLACAYARARGTDRMSSFGDWIALSDTCDEITASIIRHEVSDGIIAPDYTPKALEILKEKRKGGYAVVKIDKDYTPPEIERRDIFGITFEQGRNTAPVINPELFNSPVTNQKNIPDTARRDLTLALITLKYTQSNSVCYTLNGQTLGVGAGQQSRLHCVRLAGEKADLRLLRMHPKVLNLKFKADIGRPERDNAIENFITNGEINENLFELRPEVLTPEERREWLNNIKGVSLGSDAFFPFPDNIERAVKSGVSFIAQPGGSIRDDLVIEACNKYNIAMVMTGQRLFHH